jgi:hypothetical protein
MITVSAATHVVGGDEDGAGARLLEPQPAPGYPRAGAERRCNGPRPATLGSSG